MKKIFLLAMLLSGTFIAQAQLRIGIKAGANFADFDSAFETKMRTGFHFGLAAELKLPANFAIQPELLYSAQGADVTLAKIETIEYNYIAVPVMVKYYILSDILSLEAGPQFSFLVNDKNNFNVGDSSTFDFAALGGIGLHLGKHVFIQGRYVIGLTEASTNADFKNKVIQISAGYFF